MSNIVQNFVDDCEIGDTVTKKNDDTIRLYFLNVNGISPYNESLRSLLIDLESIQTDCVCLSEHNMAVDNYSVSEACRKVLRTVHQHHRWIASTSKVSFERVYKPGGTISLIKGSLTSRVRSQYADPYGRWCCTILGGKRQRKLAILNAYQVSQRDHSRTGPFTAQTQQRVQLASSGRPPLPRKCFLLDIKQYIHKLQTTGCDIILGGDFNETLESSNGVSQLCRECSLMDASELLLGTSNFSTYNRGQARLDYFLVSQSILPTITSHGYEPFYMRSHSDHRGFFVDLDTKLIFGAVTQPLAPMSGRDFRATDPRAVRQYIVAKHEYLAQHNFFKRIQDLDSSIQLDTKTIEGIDRDLTAASLHAAKSTHKVRVTPWSVNLHLLHRKVKLLKTRLTCLRLNKAETSPREWDIELEIPRTKRECQVLLRQAQKDLQSARANASILRSSELEHRAAILAAMNDQQAAKILRRLQRAEAISQVYQKLRFLRKKYHSSGLSCLEVPKDPFCNPKKCDDWILVEEPTEIEEYLLRRNERHFGQAHGTPLTVSPLSSHFNFEASTVASDLVLRGQYDDSELDEITALLLRHVKTRTSLDSTPSSLSATQLLAKLKSWSESTSTSPSGLHLGHYHSLYRPFSFQSTADKEDIELKRTDILLAHTSILNYCLRYGYSLKRWHSIVNVMIEKDPGSSKVHRLRVIHLYEADYTMLLSIKWRELLHHCEDHYLLHRNLFGSRPGKSAHDPVFLEEMENEICRTSRKPMIRSYFDATSCYDRILPSFANLVCLSHGMHSNATTLNGDMLLHAQYSIKTNLGISEERYAHSSTTPIYGTGQGSASSPTYWLLISNILVRAHESRAHGAIFATPDRSLRTKLGLVAFVDDVSGRINDFMSSFNTSLEELVALMQDDAQLWNDLLWGSGGALELPKCQMHLIRYDFCSDGSPLLHTYDSGNADSPRVVLQSPHGDRFPIDVLSNFTPYKTLGCWKSPSTTFTKQRDVLRKKSDFLASVASKGGLSRGETWTFYTAIYLPSITYPLATCHFTKSQLEVIQHRAMMAIIPQCGFSRSTKRTVLYSPQCYGGAGFTHLYSMQGISHIKTFLQHWRLPGAGSCRPILKIALSWAQANAGTSWPILEYPSRPLPHFESLWFKTLREYLTQIHGSLEVDDPHVLPIQRVHDHHIMDLILESEQFKPDEVRVLNYCRLFLQAHTLSDLSLAHGLSLDLNFLEGNTLHPLSSKNLLIPFVQESPDDVSWKLWKKANLLWADPQGNLHQPLQDWIVPLADQRRVWKHYYSPTSKHLYVSSRDDGTGYFDMYRGQRHGLRPKFCKRVRAIPSDCSPIHLFYESPFRWMFSPYSIPRAPPVATFADFLDNLPEWRQHLSKCSLFVPPFQLLHTIRQASCIWVSDGSSRDPLGSFGWKMATIDGNRLAAGHGTTWGSPISSFRAEAFGVCAVLQFVQGLLEYCCYSGPTTIPLCIRTDSKSLIQKIGRLRSYSYLVPSLALTPHWDVLSQILQLWSHCLLRISLQYVAGHQDREKSFQELPLDAQLNVEADALATAAYDMSARPPRHLFPACGAQLILHSNSIQAHYKTEILRAEYLPAILSYYQERRNWSTVIMDLLNWKSLFAALRRSYSNRVNLTKLLHDILPTGKIAHRYRATEPHSCPVCGSPQETWLHMLQCAHPSRAKWRSSFLKSTGEFLRKNLSTPEPITTLLLSSLESTLLSRPLPCPAHPFLQRCMHHQQLIGWMEFFRGHVALIWEDALRTFSSDPTDWSSRLICHLWDHILILWELRNKDKHGRDAQHEKSQRLLRLHAELEALYALRPYVLSKDREFFWDSLENHKTDHSRTIAQWLRSYGPLLRASAKAAKRQALVNVPDIRTFFST